MRLRPHVLLSILTIAFLTCILPNVHAQTTTITDISYPKKSTFNVETRTADPSLTVSATVGFSDARVGDFLAVGIFDLESGGVENGSGNASPAQCVPGYLYAGCLVVITSSAGTEHVTFQLTSPRRVMQLSLVAVIYSNSSTLVSGSTSDVEFVIRVDTALTLQLNAPNAVTVIVDGKEVGHGSFSLSLIAGSHNVSIPDIVQVDDATRIKFKQWSDGVTQENRTFELDHSITLGAAYQTQYHLTLTSPQVGVTGIGWYTEGSVANFSAPLGVQPMNGLLGTIGGNWKFEGWYEGNALLSDSAAGQIMMNQPHNLEARWQGDYTKPLLFMSPLLAALGASALIIQRLALRKRGRRTKRRVRRRRQT